MNKLDRYNLVKLHKNKILEKIKNNTIIDSNTNCHLWQGAKCDDGYGIVYFREGKLKVTIKVHRFSAYFYLNLDLDISQEFACHKNICPNRNCWNPEHLYVGNVLSNHKDSLENGTVVYFGNKIRKRKQKTICKEGHDLMVRENYFIGNKGTKMCKICRNKYLKDYRASHD